MSLDVTLFAATPQPCKPTSGIFIREGGRNIEISEEEWNIRFPGRVPVRVTREWEAEDTRVFRANITHNLGRMAKEAGLYEELWRPEEVGITRAKELIIPLQNGLEVLTSDPEWFKQFNPENGWGEYAGLVVFVTDYLTACREHPDATIGVSR